MRQKLFEIGEYLFAKLVGAHLLTSDADYRKRMRQKILFGEIIESRKQFAFRKVAGRSEDDHHTRFSRFSCLSHIRSFNHTHSDGNNGR